MSLVTLLPFIVLIGAMFLMTRSAKRKQQQAVQMRDQMQPGSGVRTIGGMYATVKEVHEDAVLLEVAPGTHAFFAKNAIGAVLADDEYNRIVHGSEVPLEVDDDTPIVPDDVSSLTETDAPADTVDKPRIDLSKTDEDTADADDAPEATEPKAAEATKDADADDAPEVVDAKPKQTDGEPEAK